MKLYQKFGVWIGLLLVIAGLALWWWQQPEQQVRRAQKQLIKTLESRDFAAFERFLAEDYSDRWGQNKAIVKTHMADVLRQFIFLTIVAEEKSLEPSGGGWVLSARIQLQGTSAGLAAYAQSQVSRLQKPFEITWRKNAGSTKWVIAKVEQPELEF